MAARTTAHFYVYYRVAADSAAARATIGAMMADVEACTGVAGRLLARLDDPRTWMEVYEPVPDASAFSRQLAALVRRHGAMGIALDGKRHVERFAALPAIAPSATV